MIGCECERDPLCRPAPFSPLRAQFGLDVFVTAFKAQVGSCLRGQAQAAPPPYRLSPRRCPRPGRFWPRASAFANRAASPTGRRRPRHSRSA